MGSVNTSPTPLETGLTAAQVKEHVREGLGNHESARVGKTTGRILRENLLTLFNVLNLALAVAVLAVGSLRNALFMGVVFSNAIIGTFQEIRARRTVEKLKLVVAPEARVLREGRWANIPLSEIVLDDLILFETGNQVPVDASVRDGFVEMDESLLTGESLPVKKNKEELLLSGSFVVSGRCVAQVTRVGDSTYAATLAREAKKIAPPRSELMRALNALIRGLSIVIVPLGLILFIQQYYLHGDPVQDSVVSTVAAMIGMIPEGLVLLTSVALAVGVVRLARRKTLVQSLYSMEDLARVDILCLDKTGTITSGNLSFERIELLSGDETGCARLLGAMLGAVNGSDATARALMPRFPADPNVKTGRVVPFSSARKWSGAEIDGCAVVLGAPQFVLPGADDAFGRKVAECASGALRVLVVAKSPNHLPEDRLPEGLTPLALVLLTDEIRPEAPDTLKFFEREGVTIKVISGDDAVTVSAIAMRAGVKNAEHFVDATTLRDEAAVRDAATRITVFGRVTPAQKKMLVRALKDAGHTVAMTGDGVNDIPALKEADCSVAMASGSDAARQVASLVLLDCNFASMPEVVMEGRRVINNIRRSASLFLTKTVFSFLLSVLSLITGAGYPFVPIQLTLFSTVAVGMPSFLLALEPNRARVQGRFMPYVLSKALPGGLTIALGAWALNVLGAARGFSGAETGTMATFFMVCVGLMVLLAACWPLNLRRAAVFLFASAVLAVAILGFPWFFELTALSPAAVRLAALASCAALPVFFGLNALFSRIFQRILSPKGLHP
jgi:cation-transporting ATPase E